MFAITVTIFSDSNNINSGGSSNNGSNVYSSSSNSSSNLGNSLQSTIFYIILEF